MQQNSPLYNALHSWLGQAVPWAHRSHLTTCLWMVVALLQRGEVSLSRWIPYIPCRGNQAQSKQRRLSRWLHNSRLNIHRLYKPLIQTALAQWQEQRLYLCLDTSLFWQQYCLVRLAVVHRGRALPVVWRVLNHSSASVAFEDYRALLYQAAHRLPQGVEVILLADRGFIHTEAMSLVTTQLGWHYRIRIKGNTWIWRGKRGWGQLKDIPLQRGEAYGPVHVVFGYNNLNGEF